MSFVLPRPPEELMNLVQKANQVPLPAKRSERPHWLDG